MMAAYWIYCDGHFKGMQIKSLCSILNIYSAKISIVSMKLGRKKIVFPNEEEGKRERKRERKKYLFGHLFVSGTEALKPLRFC